MIEINLLKKRYEIEKKKILTLKFVFFYFICPFFIFSVCAFLYISNKVAISRIKNEIEKLKKKASEEKGVFEIIRTQQNKCPVLYKKFSFYEDEYKNRIPWSDKLTLISSSIPDGMWLTKLSYKNEYSEKGRNLYLIAEGFVSPFFIRPPKALSYFAKNIKERGNNLFGSIKLVKIEKREIEENDVYYFKFEIEILKKNGKTN
jgi:hypothetical protein